MERIEIKSDAAEFDYHAHLAYTNVAMKHVHGGRKEFKRESTTERHMRLIVCKGYLLSQNENALIPSIWQGDM